MHVYLAGAMEYAPDRGCGWRSDLSIFLREELNQAVFNPCEEEPKVISVEERQHMARWKREDLPKFRAAISKIILYDIKAVLNETDYIIVYWDEHVLKGAGTHGELTVARYHNIPVYMVSDIAPEKMSSWIIGCTTEIFPDFESLKEFLSKKFDR